MVRASNTDRRFEMADTVHFNRDYAAFGSEVKAYEKADDVGLVISEIICEFLFPVRALINAKISGIWLGEGEKPANDTENIDLLFKEAKPQEPYIDIILRSTGNSPVYGGWVAGQTLQVTNEIVNGYRVLLTMWDGEQWRWEVSLDDSRYHPAAGANLSSAAARKMQRKSHS
jgi:hypothetical protein